MTQRDPTSGTRTCGGCTMCCKTMRIEELAKPAGTWCPHAAPGTGCGIYADRPASCRSFNCLWLLGQGPQDCRPDKIGLVLWTTEHGYLSSSTTGEKRQLVMATERHEGHALADTRARAVIQTLLKLGTPVVLQHAAKQRLLSLDRGGNIRVVQEVDVPDSSDAVQIPLTVRGTMPPE